MSFGIRTQTRSSSDGARPFSRLLLLAIVVAIGAAPSLWGDTFWGAFASGSARQFEITCGTCPNPVTDLSSLQDGAIGSTHASVGFSNEPSVEYFAHATLDGPGALPTLHALAFGNVTTSAPSTFFYAATALARGTQLYTYTGTSTAEYTLEYDLDGTVEGGLLSELSGGFSVFGSGFNPTHEIQPTLGFTFDHANGAGEEVTPVHLTGDVTFTVNPGDSIYVQSTLIAIVDSRSSSILGSVDALNTLDMKFTEGDASLLVPAGVAGSTVPEPASLFLLGAGLPGTLLALHRKPWRRSKCK